MRFITITPADTDTATIVNAESVETVAVIAGVTTLRFRSGLIKAVQQTPAALLTLVRNAEEF